MRRYGHRQAAAGREAILNGVGCKFHEVETNARLSSCGVRSPMPILTRMPSFLH